MSENEIDALEIVVESEANRANRALSGLEKRIDKATTALEKFMIVAQGGVSFKNVDVDKLFSGNAPEQSAKREGKKLADSLISGFNLNKATPEIQRQVRELSQKIATGLSSNGGKAYTGLNNDIEALGKVTAKNGSIAKSTSEEYQKLYNWIKTTSKIKIAPETAKSLGDSYKERIPVLKQKLSTKDGIELDSFYNEAKDMFPGLLKDVYSAEDEFFQLNNAMEKFYETSNSFYKPDWLEDSAYESVAIGVSDIAEELKKVQKESTDLTGSINGVVDTGKSFSDIFGSSMDTSGLERVIALTGNIRNQSGAARTSRSNLKYPVDSFENLYKKFKDSTFDVDFSDMGTEQLKKKISEYERGYNRIKQEIADIQKLEGTDTLGGKAWYSKIMQMNQYENALDSATEALGKFLDKSSEIDSRIIRGSLSASNDKQPNTAQLGGYKEYDAENLQREIDGLGNATREASTFEEQIKQLKAELRSLGNAGFGQYDPQYDAVARELAEVVAAKKEYDKAMRTQPTTQLENGQSYRSVASAINQATKKASVFKRVLGSLNGPSKSVNSTKKSFDNLGKAIKNAKSLANKAIHPFKTLKSLMGDSEKSGNGRRMNLGRMVGSSVLFSTVFGAISQIKQAVKEGSNNLVQYSSEYNNSISGMVSSLLYLKNAWAVAFAPIVNVVGPYVSTFIDMIASALNSVGQFMAALTGKGYVVKAKKAWKDYGASIADSSKSTDKANESAKKLQKTILGFDELNVLNSNDSSSGSGSGSGSGGKYTDPSANDMFETIEVPNSMNQLAEKFKEAMKNSDFSEIGQMVGDKLKNALENIPWDSVYQKADNFGKGLATFLNGLISPELFYDLGTTVAGAINTAFHALNSFAINFDWKDFGASLASSIKGFFENWDAKLSGETFSNFGKGLLESITSFIDTLGDDKTWETIGQKVVDFICGIDWKGLMWDFAKLFDAFARAFIEFPADFSMGVAGELANKIFGDNLTDEMKTRTSKTMTEVVWFLQSTIGKLNPISKVAGIVRSVFTVVSGGWTAIQTATKGIPAWFDEKFSNARKNANVAFEDVGEWYRNKKSDIQNGMDDISEWFGTKYRAARENANSAFSNIGTWFRTKRTDIQDSMSPITTWFRNSFKEAYRGITSAFDGIKTYFDDVAGWIESPVKNALNGVRKAVNWIYVKLGGKGDLIPAFATGTNNNGVTRDTFGMVNDQSGNTYREMIQFPNGKTIIPQGRNVVMPLPKGTKVLPADKTETLMKMQNIPHFKSGIGDFFSGAWAKFKDFTGDILDYVENPRKLMQIAIDKFTDLSGVLEPGLSITKGAINTVFDSAVSSIKGLLKSFGERNSNSSLSDGVEQWRNLAKTALLVTGMYSESNLTALLNQMQHESGGNPNAINLWDSNAKKGIPSKGLMQVIEPTFKRYAISGYNSNIYDPLSNMIASIRYTVSRYGSLYAGWTARGYKGYSGGGNPMNGEVYVANENGFGSEYIGRMGNRHVVANNQQITDGIKSAVIDGMMEVYMATAGNNNDSTIPYIINAVLKTEDNEVLARAVERGQARRNERFNPSPAY